jgi:hypothetical protein
MVVVAAKPKFRKQNVDERTARDCWVEGARRLSEEGRLAWLLGMGLQEALDGMMEHELAIDAPTAVDRLRSLVWKAMDPALLPGFTLAAGQPQSRPPKKAENSRHHEREASSFSWPQVCTSRLAGHNYPVIFVGAKQIRGKWASLALGVDLHGRKHVLGGRDDADSAALLADLAGRGLSASSGLLIVTDGSPRLDEAARKAWQGRAQLQHCLYRLRRDLQDHTPVDLHPMIEARMAGACREQFQEAKAALDELLVRFRTAHPGAASRLERSIGPGLSVARLEVGGVLREHLQTLGVLRAAWDRATRFGDGSARGLEAVTSGLGEWLERSHRLRGHTALASVVDRMLQATQELGDSCAK